MKARCPNDPKHDQFLTVANVMEEWKVDAEGNWLETTQALQTNNGPDPDNTWTCAICGEEAVVED